MTALRRRGAAALALTALASVTTILSLFAWTVLPTALGWAPSVVVSASMEPAVEVGDVIVLSPVGSRTLEPGNVIRFPDPNDPDRYLIHRIYAVPEDGTVITRGDNNENADSTVVSSATITGLARLRVPWIGLPAVWRHQGRLGPLGLVFASFLVAVAGASTTLRRARA
jgi:signal peptidase